MRTFNILALTGIGLSIISTINGIMSKEAILVIASLAAGVLAAILMCLFTFTHFQLPVKIVTITLIFGIIFPFIFYNQGKTSGFGVLIFALGVVFTSLLIEKRRNAIAITILLTIYYSLFIIHSFFPPFQYGEIDYAILRETLINFYVYCIAISATVIWLIDAYEREAEKLRILNEKKIEFLSTFSHELKTPLTSIQGFAQYAFDVIEHPSDDPADDQAQVQSSFESIKQSAEWLNRMSTQLLAVTLIEQGIVNIDLAPCDIKDIAIRISSEFEQINHSENRLHVIFPENTPILKADPDKLVQVLLNLMINANKYTENGSITLTAKVCTDEVQIDVTDTGSGIPKELIPYLFHKFPQAEIEGVKADHGLGLYICKNYMAAMGGKIHLSKTSDEGTQFVLTVPILQT
ncbi:MAG: hypothetical protein LBM60_09330 [Clostridium sp.]|jgi:signal transduction histidine kinase|nr:hypothetical protein [Clostridium sp.]